MIRIIYVLSLLSTIMIAHYDTSHNELANRIKRTGSLTYNLSAVALSPDNKTVAIGSWDGTLCLWNLDINLQIRQSLKNPYAARFVIFSPDSTMLAFGSDDGALYLWNIKINELRTIQTANYVRSAAFSPCNKIVAFGTSDGTIRLWDIQTGQQISDVIKAHGNYVLSVEFSPDGKTLASYSFDNETYLWDIETGKKIETLNAIGITHGWASPAALKIQRQIDYCTNL